MKQENKFIILAAILIIGSYAGFKYLPKYFANRRAQATQAQSALKTNGKTEPAPSENKTVQCGDWLLQEYTLSVKSPAPLEMIDSYERVDVIGTYKTEESELIAATIIQNARAFAALENEAGGADIKLCLTPEEADALRNGAIPGETWKEAQYDIVVRNVSDHVFHPIKVLEFSKFWRI
jgi:hypothetical protein